MSEQVKWPWYYDAINHPSGFSFEASEDFMVSHVGDMEALARRLNTLEAQAAVAGELMAALDALDCLYSGAVGGFANQVRTEDWGEGWLEEAIPTVREAYMLAAAALDHARKAGVMAQE